MMEENGLQNILTEFRKITLGKLIVVFGAGGDRDKDKRHKMGAIAEKLADKIIITSDNPRFENPSDIMNDIASGIKDKSNTLLVEDRYDAVKKAISIALPYDTIILAGKGHEEYQTIGLEKYPFNERAIIWDLLK